MKVPTRIGQEQKPDRAGTYFVSWSGDPAKPAAWRQLREQHGYLITSTWIDRFGGKNADHGADMWVMSEQWQRIEREIAQSQRLVIDLAGEEITRYGVFIEVHMAASAGVDVYIVLNGLEIDPVRYPEMKRWLERPLVRFVPDMASALAGADRVQ